MHPERSRRRFLARECDGAAPFESGGWRSDKIRTEPPLDTTGRQAAFRTPAAPLRDWRAPFEQCIRAQHGTVGDHLEGRAPKSGSQHPATEFAIIKGRPNTARAWTWEVHVPHDLIAGRLALRAVYMI